MPTVWTQRQRWAKAQACFPTWGGSWRTQKEFRPIQGEYAKSTQKGPGIGFWTLLVVRQQHQPQHTPILVSVTLKSFHFKIIINSEKQNIHHFCERCELPIFLKPQNESAHIHAVSFCRDLYSQLEALTFSLHLGQLASVGVISVRASSCGKVELFFSVPLTDLQQSISRRLPSTGLTLLALLLLGNVPYEAFVRRI